MEGAQVLMQRLLTAFRKRQRVARYRRPVEQRGANGFERVKVEQRGGRRIVLVVARDAPVRRGFGGDPCVERECQQIVVRASDAEFPVHQDVAEP